MAQNDTLPELTPKQALAVNRLLSGATVGEAARQTGVSERQLHRWRRQPAFQAALAAGEREMLAEASRRMSVLLLAATSAFDQALRSDQPIGLRLRAGAIVWDRKLALREQLEIEERLLGLEERLGDMMEAVRDGYSISD